MERPAILHTGAEARAGKFSRWSSRNVPRGVLLVSVMTVIGTHPAARVDGVLSGKNMKAVAYEIEKR